MASVTKRTRENHRQTKIANSFRENSILGHGDLNRSHGKNMNHFDAHHERQQNKKSYKLERGDLQDDGEKNPHDRQYEIDPHGQCRGTGRRSIPSSAILNSLFQFCHSLKNQAKLASILLLESRYVNSHMQTRKAEALRSGPPLPRFLFNWSVISLLPSSDTTFLGLSLAVNNYAAPVYDIHGHEVFYHGKSLKCDFQSLERLRLRHLHVSHNLERFVLGKDDPGLFLSFVAAHQTLPFMHAMMHPS